ncbi:glutamine amidotransferase [Citrobacter koseri]|uniref:Glutamine amidotransferase n=1 Tax=Citrobacter koseri TaxID=545 RepID=A0A2X2VJB6_CITKO|nr:glutamine amidotransferase [Citrobacter koseri]
MPVNLSPPMQMVSICWWCLAARSHRVLRLEECPYFDSLAEQRLINQAISARRIVIGICLGSQLIGEALGAKVRQSPEKEIGHYPITLTEAGKQNPLLAHFGSPLVVGHWHNDMPGLTDQSVVLATSEGCPRQIVQYGNAVYGFQCHMEFTAEAVEGLIQHSEQELAAAKREALYSLERRNARVELSGDERETVALPRPAG